MDQVRPAGLPARPSTGDDARVPGPRRELRRVADAAATDDLEGLTRPVLELLRHMTGMEST